MSDIFEGDVLLVDTPDGGEIDIQNGLVMADRSFTTAVYLSLFGGNESDGGKVDNDATWWGNRFREISETERMTSKLQSLVRNLPLTSKNIRAAEVAAREDLSWLETEGIADEITTSIRAIDRHRIDMEIVVKKSGELIEKGNYTIQWEAAANVV